MIVWTLINSIDTCFHDGNPIGSLRITDGGLFGQTVTGEVGGEGFEVGTIEDARRIIHEAMEKT